MIKFYLTVVILLRIHIGVSQNITGRILSIQDSLPISGALISIPNSNKAISDSNGEFLLQSKIIDGFIYISHQGYQKKIVKYPIVEKNIYLTPHQNEIQEVTVSTGYYKLPKERLTGSFSHIAGEVLQQNMSPNIIDRLEGAASSIQFDRRISNDDTDRPNLRLRGVSTIYAESQPLIIVDNFPYEGDISSINPNDIEDIVLLKDAAASSIWGARAGNGVIVINTKKGKKAESMMTNFTMIQGLKDKPDVFWNPFFVSSPEFIYVEKKLFSEGYYNADENALAKPILSPVVELLIAERDGLISSDEALEKIKKLKNRDIRDDINRYLYRKERNERYFLNFRGGSEKTTMYISSGLDKEIENLIGNSNNRFTISFRGTYEPLPKLTISTDINYNNSNSEIGGAGQSLLDLSGKTIYPYASLVSENGDYQNLIKDYRTSYVENSIERGLLDWMYRPLEERELSVSKSNSSEIRLRGAANYLVINSLNVEFNYQYHRQMDLTNDHYQKESYYVRNLVNRYTQSNGARPIPYGGILRKRNNELIGHSARGQLNYQKFLGDASQLSAIAGMEIRQIEKTSSGFGLYGYDDDLLTYNNQIDYITRYPVQPNGTARISDLTNSMNGLTDRFLSYYANLAYSYKDRYNISTSSRWDASNLFGVKSNQKGVPLWSIGASWNVSNENIWRLAWMSDVRLRATFGYNGNVSKEATAYVTARFANDTFTGLPAATIVNPGNPSLRWEKIKVWNFGAEFSLFNRIITAKVDWYSKNGTDLLGRKDLDPTMGFPSLAINNPLRINYADIVTKGLDAEISYRYESKNFQWKTDFLASIVRNKVTDYKVDDALNIYSYLSGLRNLPPIEGRSLDDFYSMPWYGLDAQSGNPLVLVDGELLSGTQAYTQYIRGLAYEDLIYTGLSVPPVFGSFRNTVTWKDITISGLLTFKSKYFFRRSTIEYNEFFKYWRGHSDFYDRWQFPGDELLTDIPSLPSVVDNSENRDMVYLYSQNLVEKGSHIRFQDINVSYSMRRILGAKSIIKQLRIFGNVNNVGIIWRANDKKLDPDYPSLSYLPRWSWTIGINASF